MARLARMICPLLKCTGMLCSVLRDAVQFLRCIRQEAKCSEGRVALIHTHCSSQSGAGTPGTRAPPSDNGQGVR